MTVKYKNKDSEKSAKWNRENPERCKVNKTKSATKNRLKTNARQRENYRRCKAEADEIKSESGCVRCGIKDARCLDFHHLEPGTKSWTIGRWQHSCTTPKAIRKEAEKCEVLCANCHRIHHAEERERANSIP